jgi:hypothetical protein
MKYLEIAAMPTSISVEDMRSYLDQRISGVHESVMRSSAILQKVKEMLMLDVPASVIEEAIEVMEFNGLADKQKEVSDAETDGV